MNRILGIDEVMYRGNAVAVVIPAFNEANKIAGVIETLPGYVDAIVLVDDGSQDETVEVALGCNKPLRVIRHRANAGVGAAIVTGYRCAFESADIAVVMAGDGQMDPSDLPNLLDAIIGGGAGYAKGNRFENPEVWKVMPKHRLVGNIALSYATKVATGFWNLFDSQCGYTALSKEAFLKLPIHGLNLRYGYPNYLLAMLKGAGVSVVDVPVTAIYGPAWQSGINVRKVVFTIPTLLAFGFVNRKSRWQR